MDLRDFRTLVGWTLESVADEVGSTKGTLSKIEHGLLVPRGDLMLRLSHWAEEERRRRRLPASQRLEWDHLLAE
jgi:transcriptional regulator with XRE-family HTH domain